MAMHGCKSRGVVAAVATAARRRLVGVVVMLLIEWITQTSVALLTAACFAVGTDAVD